MTEVNLVLINVSGDLKSDSVRKKNVLKADNVTESLLIQKLSSPTLCWTMHRTAPGSVYYFITYW